MMTGKDQAKLKVAADALMKAAELLTEGLQLLDSAANALAQMNDLDEAERYAKTSLAAAEKNNEPYPEPTKRYRRSIRQRAARRVPSGMTSYIARLPV